MPGFWSSNLYADVTLIVQIVFYLMLCAGVVAQLQGKYKWHDRLQVPVVVLNVFFIILVMLPTFRAVAGDLPGNLNQAPAMVTLTHAGLGTLTQLLAIYCLLAGLKILPRKIGTLRYWMWAAYSAWTATIIFGIGVYILFYLTPTAASTAPQPVAEHDADLTGEHAAPFDESPALADPSADEIVAEHAEPPEAQSAQPQPTADVASGPVAPSEPGLVEETPAGELVEEHIEEAVQVEEPVFAGQAVQAQWQALQPTSAGPGPRYEHAMQYNPATNRLFVFGGRNDSQTFNDVWALNLDTLAWRQLAANAQVVAPPARFSAVMIVDEAGENLYIATGHTQDGQNFNDVWKLNLASETWTDLTASAGPPPEARYGGPGGNLGGNLVTTHGFGSTRYDDTWRFNLATEQWENITPGGALPLRRCLFAAAPAETNLVIHGGCASGFGDCFLDDTWLLDTAANAWQQVLSDVKPAGRQYHSLAAAGANQVILFGGQDASRAARNDVWILNLDSGSWQPIETAVSPDARYQHAAAWVPGLGMLLFGGRNDSALGDMWLLTLPAAATIDEAPAPQPTPAPPPSPTPELVSEHDGG